MYVCNFEGKKKKVEMERNSDERAVNLRNFKEKKIPREVKESKEEGWGAYDTEGRSQKSRLARTGSDVRRNFKESVSDR